MNEALTNEITRILWRYYETSLPDTPWRMAVVIVKKLEDAGLLEKEGQMPTFEFKCPKCFITLEQYFGQGDEPTMRCFDCQEEMIKQFTPPAIHFKGDGWGGK